MKTKRIKSSTYFSYSGIVYDYSKTRDYYLELFNKRKVKIFKI